VAQRQEEESRVLKKLSFRSKLLLVLFVPFLALVVISGAGLSDRFTALRAQEQFGGLEQPFATLRQLSTALQHEAVVNQWYVNSNRDESIPIEQARIATDIALDQFRAAEMQFRNADIGTAGTAALDRVDAGLQQIDEERTRIERQAVESVTPPLLLLATDDNLLKFGQEVARRLYDPAMGVAISGVLALEREQTELAREVSAMLPLLASGDDSAFASWLRAIASGARNRQQFLATAVAADAAAFDVAFNAEALPPDLLRPQNSSEQLPTSFPDPSKLTTPAGYYAAYQRQAQRLDDAITAVSANVSQRSAESSSSARNDVWVYGGVAVVAMLLTIALMWVVARAVVRPLRRLTESARDISQNQLPQLVEQLRVGRDVSTMELTHVEVTSEDEIGELAQAFEDVQAVTIDVAQEQSRLLRKGMGDLFVNLARRNQSLLERQLELLDELERNEHDPSALDALFKLDHMATRMRRNAESLLVLSGAEQPRQWQQPIALLDVVRAAAAEIADFPRVELVGIDDDLSVSGRAVADVAHLLAELLENATSFSPPDSAVVVSGATTATGFVLAISDQGIGVPPERIREANDLLARPPVVGLALSRALGLHVVASLAARHGISVELRPGAPVGLVALVTLPETVLERARATVPPPPEPLFAPDFGPDGAPAPLTTRRVAWRPPDEPPVEEWRREAEPVGAVVPDAVTPEVGRLEDAPVVPEVVVPEALVSEVVVPEPTREAPAASEEQPTVTEPPPPAESHEPGRPDPGSAPGAADDDFDDAPLPTRVPGQHMSHQPLVDGDGPNLDADPLRPYRVHELLTRHDQGKRRGRSESPDPESPVLESVLEPHDPAPEGER
jgi:signal transduction histidine kinase